MLPPFIIEQIRQREEQERSRQEQPQLELPLAPARPPTREPKEDTPQRGVVILDLLGD
jgi:hypothetical protein